MNYSYITDNQIMNLVDSSYATMNSLVDSSQMYRKDFTTLDSAQDFTKNLIVQYVNSLDPIPQYRVAKFRKVITKNPLTNEVLSSERFEALDSLNNPGLTETDLFKIEYPPRLEEIVGISDLKDTLKGYMKDYGERISFGENIFEKQIISDSDGRGNILEQKTLFNNIGWNPILSREEFNV